MGKEAAVEGGDKPYFSKKKKSCDGASERRRPVLFPFLFFFFSFSFSHAFPSFLPPHTHSQQESVRPTHLKPESLRQKLAYAGIQLVRRAFDAVTLYDPNGPNPESRWLRRMLFLETVAGVPGEDRKEGMGSGRFYLCGGVGGRERERERELLKRKARKRADQ